MKQGVEEDEKRRNRRTTRELIFLSISQTGIHQSFPVFHLFIVELQIILLRRHRLHEY